MNKRIMPLLLLLIAAQLTTKAQMTVGGSYKPSHTLVVKGQVKIDTVKSGSIIDSLLTIGADSVLHRLSISSISNGSQTRITAGTNTTVTGTGTITTPYVINAVIPATTNTLGVSGNTITSTVNGVSANAPVVGSVSSTSTGNTLSTTVNGQTSSGANIINTNTNTLTQTGGLVTAVNGITATTPIAAGTAANVLGFSSTGAPVYQTAASVLGGATTHTVGVSGNTLTSTVNGVAATAPIIGTVSNTSTANILNTTVNGQSGSAVNIINTNTSALTQTGGLINTVNGISSTIPISAGTATNVLGFNSTGAPVYQTPAAVLTGATTHTVGVSGNTLTSTVNGVAATAPVISSISATTTGNTLSTTVNGQTSAGANIINTNTSTLTQAGGLVNSVNGVTATTSIPAGTAANVLGFNSTGTPVYQTAASVLTGATTNTLGVSGNTITSTVNGVSANAPVIGSISSASTGNTLSTTVNGQTSTGVNIINTNTNAFTQAGGLVNTVNGIAATTPIAAGTAANVLGFSSTGAPVYQTAASVLGGATTHTVGVSGNTLTSTVNGVAATTPLIGAVTNASTANTLTTTVNGQSGSAVNIINSNTLTNTNGSLTSTINGISSTPVPVLISSSNGLTTTNGNVVLGGTLTAATTTIAGGANKLSITSSATDGFAVDGTTLSVDAVNHRVGFGTNAPATNLDVRASTAGTALRIADGSQGADKILVSDASGNASWATLAGNTKVVWGTLTSASASFPLSANKYTGSYITLPPGKWVVNITMTISTTNTTSPNIVTGAGVWERATLSDVNTGTAGPASADIIGTAKQVAGGMTGPNDYGLLAGALMVSNTSGANKTYYFWHKVGISYSPNILSVVGVGLVLGASSSNSTATVSLANFGSTAWSEDELFATPINY